MNSERFIFPAIFTPDEEDGGYVVTFSDIPEAVTQGDTLEEALFMAKDVLRTVLDFRIQEREPIPFPSTIQPENHAIYLPHLVNAKLAIYEIMREQKITEAIVCSRLHCDLTHICKLLDLYHDSDMNALESALSVLGKQLNFSVVDAA